jgi:Brp/Blh family beta-carotene 15,15'-monooxygenase
MIIINTLQKIVQKLDDIRVYVTISCVIISFITTSLAIDYLAIFGVLTLGILHGANDLSLLQSIRFMRTKSQRFLVYIATVLLFSLILYHFPMTALLFFVWFSCYHFGEQQWTHRFQSKTNSPQFFYFVYGAFLFSMLFWSHAEQTQFIIKELSDLHITPISFQYMTFTSVCFCVLYLLLQFSASKTLIIDVLLQSALLMLLFWTTNLIVSFGTYFIIWHSWPSLQDQTRMLYNKPNAYFEYLKDAFPYWIISILGLSLFFVYNEQIGLNPLALFFAFLAAITFPHVLVIFGLHQKFKLS